MPKECLVVVDMLSTYDFPDGEQCAKAVRSAFDGMLAEVRKAREGDIPVVYVNDHYDRWDGDRTQLVDWVMETTKHRDLVEPLLPEADDVFIAKARHSIFYETPLAYFLTSNDIEQLTLIGQVTEQCILYSALDAHVRHLHVAIPTGAVAAIDEELGEAALELMRRNMGAEIV